MLLYHNNVFVKTVAVDFSTHINLVPIYNDIRNILIKKFIVISACTIVR